MDLLPVFWETLRNSSPPQAKRCPRSPAWVSSENENIPCSPTLTGKVRRAYPCVRCNQTSLGLYLFQPVTGGFLPVSDRNPHLAEHPLLPVEIDRDPAKSPEITLEPEVGRAGQTVRPARQNLGAGSSQRCLRMPPRAEFRLRSTF